MCWAATSIKRETSITTIKMIADTARSSHYPTSLERKEKTRARKESPRARKVTRKVATRRKSPMRTRR